MTTYKPPDTYQGLPPDKVADPYPNKAIAAAVTVLMTALTQWIATGDLEIDQEGITIIGGGFATALVWYISNWKRKGV